MRHFLDKVPKMASFVFVVCDLKCAEPIPRSGCDNSREKAELTKLFALVHDDVRGNNFDFGIRRSRQQLDAFLGRGSLHRGHFFPA